MLTLRAMLNWLAGVVVMVRGAMLGGAGYFEFEGLTSQTWKVQRYRRRGEGGVAYGDWRAPVADAPTFYFTAPKTRKSARNRAVCMYASSARCRPSGTAATSASAGGRLLDMMVSTGIAPVLSGSVGTFRTEPRLLAFSLDSNTSSLDCMQRHEVLVRDGLDELRRQVCDDYVASRPTLLAASRGGLACIAELETLAHRRAWIAPVLPPQRVLGPGFLHARRSPWPMAAAWNAVARSGPTPMEMVPPGHRQAREQVATSNAATSSPPPATPAATPSLRQTQAPVPAVVPEERDEAGSGDAVNRMLWDVVGHLEDLPDIADASPMGFLDALSELDDFPSSMPPLDGEHDMLALREDPAMATSFFENASSADPHRHGQAAERGASPRPCEPREHPLMDHTPAKASAARLIQSLRSDIGVPCLRGLTRRYYFQLRHGELWWWIYAGTQWYLEVRLQPC